MLKVGGASSNNGIIFYTDNFKIKATRCKDETISVTTTIIKESRLTKLVKKVPILRGFLFALPSKTIYKIFIFLILVAEISSIITKSPKLELTEMKVLPYMLISAVVICAYLIYSHITRSNWQMYHGAEHKAIHAISKSKNIDFESIIGESTLHRLCGTVYILILIPIMVLIYIPIKHLLLSYLLASSIASEIHGLKNPLETPIIKHIFRFFLFVQRAMVKEPTDRHLEVAIAGMNELASKENSLETEVVTIR